MKILLACSIAERATGLGHESGARLSYRGGDEGMNVFLISEERGDERRGFHTRILVSEASGIVARSESVSRTGNGEWKVTAHYGVFEGFIYPTSLVAGFEQRDPDSGEQTTVRVELDAIVPHRFERAEDNTPYWRSSGDTYKKTLLQRIQIMGY